MKLESEREQQAVVKTLDFTLSEMRSCCRDLSRGVTCSDSRFKKVILADMWKQIRGLLQNSRQNLTLII